MKMSCNGCRILRKGCDQDCTLRPCLQWIQTPESQADATLFLVKFYGRAGLLNLINAAPPHLRPAVFRSLLYDACGRIINPIYESVGVMVSGNWHQCQAAVDSVLNGSLITQLPLDHDHDHDAATAVAHPIMPLKCGDIRHLSAQPNGLQRVRTRNRSKRSGVCPKAKSDFVGELNGDPSHDSFSVEIEEASLVERAMRSGTESEDSEIVLELTLGGASPHVYGARYGDEQSIGGILFRNWLLIILRTN